MKKVLFILFIFSACSKENSKRNQTSLTTLSRLQNVWKLVSVKAYADRGFTIDSGLGFFSSGSDYYDFRKDGNLYGYVLGSLNITAYNLLADDSTILVYEIHNGVKSTNADSIYIRTITERSLILAARNDAGDWGKFSFKK